MSMQGDRGVVWLILGVVAVWAGLLYLAVSSPRYYWVRQERPAPSASPLVLDETPRLTRLIVIRPIPVGGFEQPRKVIFRLGRRRFGDEENDGKVIRIVGGRWRRMNEDGFLPSCPAPFVYRPHVVRIRFRLLPPVRNFSSLSHCSQTRQILGFPNCSISESHSRAPRHLPFSDNKDYPSEKRENDNLRDENRILPETAFDNYIPKHEESKAEPFYYRSAEKSQDPDVPPTPTTTEKKEKTLFPLTESNLIPPPPLKEKEKKSEANSEDNNLSPMFPLQKIHPSPLDDAIRKLTFLSSIADQKKPSESSDEREESPQAKSKISEESSTVAPEKEQKEYRPLRLRIRVPFIFHHKFNFPHFFHSFDNQTESNPLRRIYVTHYRLKFFPSHHKTSPQPDDKTSASD